MKLTPIFSVAAAVLLSSPGAAYEIRARTNSVDFASTMQYIAAPRGMHALTFGPRNIAFFNSAGRDVDMVWLGSPGKFTASQMENGGTVVRTTAGNHPMELKFDGSGCLRSLKRDGDERQRLIDRAAMFPPIRKASLKTYWSSAIRDAAKPDYWKGNKRLRLRYENPNSAGALFAELAIFALTGVMIFKRRSLRIASAIATIPLLYLLALTGSRGALIGFLAGAAALGIATVTRRFSVGRMISVALAAVLLAGLVLCGAFGDRLKAGNLIKLNRPNMLRLKCWQSAPVMMAAAPGGWGEKCGHAYCDYFQDDKDYHPQTWLFNTHLTWMVEHGWGFRLAYCFGWAFLLGSLGISMKSSVTAAAAFATWSAWVVAAWFSTIGHCWTLWLAPIASLLIFAATAAIKKKVVSLRKWMYAAAASAIFAGGTCLAIKSAGSAALSNMEFPVHRTEGVTVIGTEHPKAWILNDDLVTSMGLTGIMGRELHDFLRRHPVFGSVAITEDAGKVADDANVVVAAGRRAGTYLKDRIAKLSQSATNDVQRIVLVSPTVKAKADLPERIGCRNLTLLSGEMLKRLYISNGETAPQWVKFAPGAALYVPGWIDTALGEGR